MIIEYFEFYRGNLIEGFDYIYGKQVDEHAFLLGIPKQMQLEPLEITTPELDFQPGKPAPKGYEKYAKYVRMMAMQWDSFSELLGQLISDWQPSYQGMIGEQNAEWGLKIKIQGDDEVHHYWGFNDAPANFEEVANWLRTLTTGHL